MEPREEIKAYLAQPNQERDYNKGYNLFCRFSNNVPVQRYLARKQDPEKLIYKLKQILEQYEIKETKIVNIPFVQKAQTATPSNTPANTPANTPVETTTADKLKIRTNGRISPEDLPEVLKPIFDKISEAYKKQRSLHEKMKIVKSVKATKELRAGIDKLEDIIRQGWDILDKWDTTGELPEVKDEDSNSTEASAKEVNAARVYLSKNLPKLDGKFITEEEKTDLVNKIKERYNLLVKAENDFSEETIAILTKHGIIETQSGEISNES